MLFFARENYINHIYTLDKSDILECRLKMYVLIAKPLIDMIFSKGKLYLPDIERHAKPLYHRIQKKEYPQWRCGKIFILEEKTGKVKKEISTEKIYKSKNFEI